MLASLNSTAQVLTIAASVVAILAGVFAFAKWVVRQIKDAIAHEVGKSIEIAKGNRTMLVSQNEHLNLPVPVAPAPGEA